MRDSASHTHQPDVVDALRQAVRQGGSSVPVQCGECDYGAEDGLVLVDRDAEDHRPAGRGSYLAISSNEDPCVDLTRCPGCLEDLALDSVILRDRHGRCAQALADEQSARTSRGLELHVALNHGDYRRAAAILGRAA